MDAAKRALRFTGPVYKGIGCRAQDLRGISLDGFKHLAGFAMAFGAWGKV